eukprot:GILI01032095.1.p1 GENE.GILI01032095.1~~GILI01032095.1.p1  ORF type:complete len:228 (+),score=6.34 GILI01032095.1:42-725(+)
MKSTLLRRGPTINDLISARSAQVRKAPFELRRDRLPESFIHEHLPPGWVERAEDWCSTVLGPHVPQERMATTGFSQHKGARHHLFLKALISPGYLPKDLDPRIRAMVLPPPATVVVGLNILKLSANTLSLYGGKVPTEDTLVGLLPIAGMAELATRWSLQEVLLHDRNQHRGQGSALPVQLVPPTVVQIIGSLSLLFGPALAGDVAIREIFPEIQRQPQSTPPLVFL